MIEIDGLTKRYGDKTAVDRLSFVVEPGVVTGFLGPNGAGKSTTMRMIAGLDRPDSGTVRVNGKHYPQAPAPMAELGILLDARSVHPGLPARSNLLALARTAGIGRRRVDEVIELAGLGEVTGTRAGVSPSVWASASAWPPRCSASRRPWSWTSRSTAWTRTACAGSGCCSSHWPPKAAPCWCPRT
jgi:ABC-type transport system involved in cytochrome bd biosynthesis fused ATPase/permease subunit